MSKEVFKTEDIIKQIQIYTLWKEVKLYRLIHIISLKN